MRILRNRPILFVALDDLVSDERKTLEIAKDLAAADCSDCYSRIGFKINLDYLLKHGIRRAVKTVRKFGRPVFVDLKMWNGERTMVSVADELIEAGVDYFTVYALADTALRAVVRRVEGKPTKILAVTFLSHDNEQYSIRHFSRSTYEAIRHFAVVARNDGCHGIILPGAMLGAVDGIRITKVATGIRPSWYKDARHWLEVEPGVAVADGADILICGSPIMKDEDPVEALLAVLFDIETAKED